MPVTAPFAKCARTAVGAQVRDLLTLVNRMDREDFGPQLRRERERRGISLEELAATTKVSVELWAAMERNDFSRWPSGIFARAFVRDYARAIGLDSDAVVNQFCRHFTIGDRRARRIVAGQAALIGHELDANERELLPAGGERRRARPREAAPSAAFEIYAPRLAAAAFDLVGVSAIVLCGVSMLGSRLLPWIGGVSVLYYTGATIGIGVTPGVRVVQAIRLRAPSLFSSRPLHQSQARAQRAG
jgi:transcriptional regulator with XRE-family HTH domain